MVRTRTKMLLAATLLTFGLTLFVVPKTQAYGSTFGTAETISTGVTSETLLSGDNYAYFKISCSVGDVLSLTLAYYSGYDLDLGLYNPSQSQVSSSAGSGTETITYTCTASGYYYIRVYRYSGIGSTPIYLTVSKTATVPGFDWMILLGITFSVAAILLVKMYKKHKFTTTA